MWCLIAFFFPPGPPILSSVAPPETDPHGCPEKPLATGQAQPSQLGESLEGRNLCEWNPQPVGREGNSGFCHPGPEIEIGQGHRVLMQFSL